jgi:hypothetical protein
MAAIKQQRDLVMAITNPGIGADIEPNGLYERSDERVQKWPEFFLTWPCTVDEIGAAVQSLSDDRLKAQQNREAQWAAAEAADREKRALEVAAEAEREASVRAKWSRFWDGAESAR